MYAEDQLLPISALQHYLFCPRRAALIHSENAWADNQFTLEGTQLHKRVDDPDQSQNLAAVRIERAVGLVSYKYGLTGKADLIEFHRTEQPDDYRIHVVEYKRGSPKKSLDLPFQVQLCAQALCVEEMLGYPVEKASIYYGKTRQRIAVELSDSLRTKTLKEIRDLHALIESRATPLPHYRKRKCERCSLFELCMPQAPRPVATASRYLGRLIEGFDDTGESID